MPKEHDQKKDAVLRISDSQFKKEYIVEISSRFNQDKWSKRIIRAHFMKIENDCFHFKIYPEGDIPFSETISIIPIQHAIIREIKNTI